jgi:hypothetical protein
MYRLLPLLTDAFFSLPLLHLCVAMGRYETLTRVLRARTEPLVVLSFDELDEIVGGLPASAKRYRAWWANKRSSQAHASAWLDAGRLVTPDFNARRAVFTSGDVESTAQVKTPIRVAPTEALSDGSTFQRIGSTSNTHVGADFESQAIFALAAEGIHLERNFAVPVGVGLLKKKHRFDLGSSNPPVLVECKSHRWTAGRNAPSAKLSVWNEAMYYFAVAPPGYRRIFFVLRDYSDSRGVTLAEHYLGRYRHLVPDGVEFWEFDEELRICIYLNPGP